MEKEVLSEKATENKSNKIEKKNFLCGVIEGFYGRPWTTEQRKDLFRKLKKWGMDSYVYGPKDDYKHRAYWRELYTVEEADLLTSLISAAKDHGITFYYALSPGLDMTYSSQKEVQTLKRKLDQVSQFGCEAFALLFDDIESELSKADKEVFQTFANAQVSVTNEICTHLGNPKFLFCPTQYCSSRAMPTVHDSEYLNTLGSKLNHDIDIMWTGNKVISKIIDVESIQEITEILRRPPVIWDNLHANDYDQKRVFLGPYSGRSPELIPHLHGVLTNPNCEFHANTIAIHTLACWSQCSLDTKVNSSLSADIKLETENDEETNAEVLPTDCLLKNIYHPRIALKNAIAEWFPEFSIEREAWGPITKPQPQVTMVMPIIPIIPSINTCMSLTTTTTTSSNSKTITVPEVNTTQLQALADVCSTVNSSSLNPITNAVMNSLVSPTKVVTNDDIINHIPTTVVSNIEIPKKIPISIVPVPIMHTKEIIEGNFALNIIKADKIDNFRPSKVDKLDSDIKNADISLDENNKHNVENNEIAENENENDNDNDNGNNNDNNKTAKKNLEEDITIDEPTTRTLEIETNTNLSIDALNMEENNLSPISTGNEPMECSSSLNSQTSTKEERKLPSEDIIMADTNSINDLNNSMQIESSEPSPISNTEMKDEEKVDSLGTKITIEDLYLLCDLFYLPFEHGSRGTKLLNEFNWLKANATVLLTVELKNQSQHNKPEVAEWLQRAEGFSNLCGMVQNLLKKISNCANKEICHDLFSYVWDIAGALTLLNGFVKWLRLGRFPQNVFTYTQGTYTWFSKGWKEAFMSGDQEPWVFRGGLTADLQRLMPVDSGNDLFFYKLPELPTSEYYVIRPFNALDEAQVYQVCADVYIKFFEAESKDTLGFPSHLNDLIPDYVVGPFVTLNPEFCIIAHNSANDVIGYAAASIDIKSFLRNIEICWMTAMCEKYPQSILSSDAQLTKSTKINNVFTAMINEFHKYNYQCPDEVSVGYPAVMTVAVLKDATTLDHGVINRLLTVSLATIRANGCFGAHVRINIKDTEQVQYYTKMGFTEIFRDDVTEYLFLGRRF